MSASSSEIAQQIADLKKNRRDAQVEFDRLAAARSGMQVDLAVPLDDIIELDAASQRFAVTIETLDARIKALAAAHANALAAEAAQAEAAKHQTGLDAAAEFKRLLDGEYTATATALAEVLGRMNAAHSVAHAAGVHVDSRVLVGTKIAAPDSYAPVWDLEYYAIRMPPAGTPVQIPAVAATAPPTVAASVATSTRNLESGIRVTTVDDMAEWHRARDERIKTEQAADLEAQRARRASMGRPAA